MNEKVERFVDRLVATSTLNCAKCMKLLRPPIVLIQDVGNVCHQCCDNLKKETEPVGIRNLSLEYIFNFIELPCEYHQQGCGERLPREALLLHIPNCAFRPIRCALKPNCDWQGIWNNFINHFCESHKEYIKTSNDDVFTFPIVANAEEINILKTSYGSFMSRLRVSTEKLNILIYDPGELSSTTNYCFVLSCTGNSGTKLELKCKLVKSMQELFDFNPETSTELKFESVNSLNVPRELRATLITDGQDYTLQGPMLRLLECQVCKQYMRPPIQQCVTGHDVCGTCKKKLTKCPLCNNNYMETRNYTVESLVSQMRYPCEYEDYGCSIKSFLTSKHELTCRFRNWNCPFASCDFTSQYTSLLSHISSDHSASCTFDTSCSLFANEACLSSVHYMVAYHRIFEINYKQSNGNYTWNAYVIGPQQPNCFYIFDVDVCNDVEDDYRSVTFTSVCQDKDRPDSSKAEYTNVNVLQNFLGVDRKLSFTINVFRVRK